MSMHSIIWKGVATLIAGCILVQHFGLPWKASRSRGQLQSDRLAASQAHNAIPGSFGWTYNWIRDRDMHDLTSWQCDAAFPELYHDIDRAVSHWQGRRIDGNAIKLENTNEAGLHLLIHDQQLRIIHTKGMTRADFRSRIHAVLNQLHRALSNVPETDESFADMEFTVVLDDFPTLDDDHTVWSFTRALYDSIHENVWLIPDYHFWAAPPESRNFTDMQAKARKHDAQLVDKKPQVVWRGVKWTAPGLRGALLRATHDRPWADVETITWRDKSKVMSLAKLCDYMFPINTEGRSWSSRLTYILNCDSVPVVHDVHWTAHYYHLLQSEVNYVPVSRDFSDLEEQVEIYLADTEAAQAIADNARTTFRERYTTPAATTCYWRKLLRGWSSVAFEPEVYVAADENYEDVQLRGISFEDFMSTNRKVDYEDG